MLTVQSCQQHQLVAIQPNEAKSCPAATCAAENVGPEARRVGVLGGHTRVSKSVDDGEVEVCWECCPLHVGRTKARTLGRKHLELSERRREFVWKRRRGKREERKAACPEHKAARTRSRLDELTCGTFNVRTATINGVNGIGLIDILLRLCATKGCGVIGLQAT